MAIITKEDWIKNLKTTEDIVNCIDFDKVDNECEDKLIEMFDGFVDKLFCEYGKQKLLEVFKEQES